MANLSQLEQQVAGLIRDESTDFEFRDVFIRIEQAAVTTSNEELAKLRTILSSFRGKIPNLISLKPIRARVRDLSDTLMLQELSERIASINARNNLLERLTGELQTQIAKANQDANLLRQIKDGVDKATKTVAEIKSIINQLTVTDATAKDKLRALVDGLDEISSIFKPQSV